MNDPNRYAAFLPPLAAGHWSNQQIADLAVCPPTAVADWLAQQELAAWAYCRLKQQPVAPELLSCLAPAYWQASAAALIKLDWLHNLHTAFTDANVPTLLLKGIALCLALYPDPAMRSMNDLDFLIRPSTIATAWNAIERTGLHPKGLWSSPQAIPNYVSQLDFYPATPQTSPLSVEIHWDLSQRPLLRHQFPLDRWWQQAHTVSWRGHTLQLLAPPAALLHTAVHQIVEHRGELRWRWLLDIDQLIRGQPTYQLTPADWAQIQQDAQQMGVLTAVQAAINLAVTYFGTPLPAAAQSLLTTAVPPAQRQQISQIAQPNRPQTAKILLNAQTSSGWRQKTAVLRHLLLPAPTYMRQQYQIRHPALLPWFYIRRFARGLGIIGQDIRRYFQKKRTP